MAHSFKLSRRIARLRAPLVAALIVALAGCDNANSFDAPDGGDQLDQGSTFVEESSTIEEDTPVQEEEAGPELDPIVEGTSLASYAGGIPIGTFHLPSELNGTRYNGSLRNISPPYLLNHLATIKAKGGKVVVSFAGNQKHFTDANGHFSLSKWKARIDRFRSVNFGSYIKDGTIIGHYLIDEPNDRTNWNGQTVPGATLDEMARYSKQIWPDMVTIVRAYPDYLDDYTGTYRYLDAAWAQYVTRKGTASTFINSNVTKAKNKGLALIVGLNVLRGADGGTKMSASQVKAWGSTLLSSSYPCAFISWQYDESYLSSTSMRSSMSYLRSQAENRSSKSCRGS